MWIKDSELRGETSLEPSPEATSSNNIGSNPLVSRGRAVTKVGRTCSPTPLFVLNIHVCTKAIQYVYTYNWSGLFDIAVTCVMYQMWSRFFFHIVGIMDS